jgi:hypothetical protein
MNRPFDTPLKDWVGNQAWERWNAASLAGFVPAGG